MSLRLSPVIRFHKQSTICQLIAEKIHRKTTQEKKANPKDFRPKTKSLLMILDRREDPVTPLLNQWTYQAAIHELLGIMNNRTSLKFGK